MPQQHAPSALVTGGSRGLGLLIARDLIRRGCQVTVLARDENELARAVPLIGEREGRRARTEVCDVRDREAVASAVAKTATRQDGLDLVVANAGIIQVAPVDALSAGDFADAMDTMFHGALHTALESLPYLRQSEVGGRLGLIGSVGGLVPVPHLVPYSCAKAAIGELAEGLRAEQSQYNVSVTAIHPGLMRTGSHTHAEFGGRSEQEFSWFSTLAGMPLLSMDAERAAARIVTALGRRRARIVLTPLARLGSLAHGVAPALVTRATSAVARLMPVARGGREETVPGSQVLAEANGHGPGKWQQIARTWGDRAASRFNEM
jgi:NAD(P)-dependent dehydrogenase (short-subunit alcohol dehydrogenase family)